MIVVTTPTGQIGSALVPALLDRGQRVRVIVRDPSRLDQEVREKVEVVVGSHGDPAVLDEALAGAEGLFWLIPPDRSAPSALEHYLRFARAAADAIRRQRVGHIVGVTSAGHGWSEPAGVLSAAFAMDEVLAATGAAYRALSLPFYLENLLGQLDPIVRQGAFSLASPADQPFPAIAVADIAQAAADLLTDLDWEGQQNVPLFGPDRLTPDQMADVMSRELGKPIAFAPMTIEALAAGIRSRGASERAVSDTTEMFAAQASGIYDADWAVAETGATDFATWCRTVLKPRMEATSVRS